MIIISKKSQKSEKSKSKMKEFVSKWKALQKEVDANTKEVDDELSEVVGKVDDSENNRDDLENLKQFTCEACSAEFDEEELFNQHQEPYEYEVYGNDCAREREKEDYIQCKDCEYSTDNFYDLGRHTYKNHSAGGRKYKEIVVDVTSVSVQTEDTNLMKCKECEHS